jgi:hypothetical protein
VHEDKTQDNEADDGVNGRPPQPEVVAGEVRECHEGAEESKDQGQVDQTPVARQ